MEHSVGILSTLSCFLGFRPRSVNSGRDVVGRRFSRCASVVLKLILHWAAQVDTAEVRRSFSAAPSLCVVMLLLIRASQVRRDRFWGRLALPLKFIPSLSFHRWTDICGRQTGVAADPVCRTRCSLYQGLAFEALDEDPGLTAWHGMSGTLLVFSFFPYPRKHAWYFVIQRYGERM